MQINATRWAALAAVLVSGMVLAACGDSGPAAGGKDGGVAGGGGHAGGSAGGSGFGGGSGGGTAGNGAGGSAGQGGTAGTVGTGGAASGDAAAPVDAMDAADAKTDVTTDVTSPADARDATTSDTGSDTTLSADGGPSDAAPEAPSDVSPPTPATTIATTTIDFGGIDCGAAPATMTRDVSNTGTGPLHYTASIAAGGLFSLQGAAAGGTISGDIAPGAGVTLTVVAGTIATTTAAGATFSGTLAILTNATGAENVQIPLTMTSQGATCTLTCGSFTKCTPTSGAPYCANTMTDNSNCGTCGNPCGGGQVCSGGVCGLTCGALTKCMPSSGAPYCANTSTDNNDCGVCGKVCDSGQMCNGGVCTLTCGALTKCSPGGATADYCANTSTDNTDCGVCGKVCGAGQTCTGGVCTLTCGSLTKCSPGGSTADYCANTSTDNANCGTCGHSCPSGQVCSGGACTLTCGSLTKCSPGGGAADYCANLMTDNHDCSTCGHACPSGQACVSGGCVPTCSATDTLCSGMCTNTAFDPSNCSTCGVVCGFANATAACLSGGCFLASCSAGHADCNRDQTDGCEIDKTSDVANCGACGHACALGESCNTGVCTTNLSQGLIGYWSFDDAVGSALAVDQSSNHLDGQVQGSVTFVPGGGKKGTGAATFGGSGYVRVVFPNDAKGQGTGIFIPQGNITFAMWFKTSSANVGGLQVVEGGQWNPGCDRVVGSGTGNTLQYNTWQEVNMSEPFIVTDGVWHQMVYVLDKTSGFKAYIDGVLEASSSTATNNCGVGCSGFDWASEYWIGRSAGCRFGADYFTGVIDDVRIYDHVLSPAGVVQLFNATK